MSDFCHEVNEKENMFFSHSPETRCSKSSYVFFEKGSFRNENRALGFNTREYDMPNSLCCHLQDRVTR